MVGKLLATQVNAMPSRTAATSASESQKKFIRMFIAQPAVKDALANRGHISDGADDLSPPP